MRVCYCTRELFVFQRKGRRKGPSTETVMMTMARLFGFNVNKTPGETGQVSRSFITFYLAISFYLKNTKEKVMLLC